MRVVLERIHRPGRRIDETSIFLSSQTEDPTLRERSMWPRYAVATIEEEELAARLASLIRARTSGAVDPEADRPGAQQEEGTD